MSDFTDNCLGTVVLLGVGLYFLGGGCDDEPDAPDAPLLEATPAPPPLPPLVEVKKPTDTAPLKPSVSIPTTKPNLVNAYETKNKTAHEVSLETRIRELGYFISVSIPRVRIATEQALKETSAQLIDADPSLEFRLREDMREYASQLILLSHASKKAVLKRADCERLLRKTALQREMSGIASAMNLSEKDLEELNRNLTGNSLNIQDELSRINASQVITEAEIQTILGEY